ncbi:MAG TPA: phage holin family protein [Bryobacteraceae bacterium]|nr:phage holin family protein [Bryobacteraceae bacterium]
MRHLLVNWLVSAVSLMIVAAIVPGIEIDGFGTALIAAVVIGLVNATLGFFLKILTFPLTLITLGAFLFVINALMLKVAAALLRGFRVKGFAPALLGAILLSLVHIALRWLL